jgi:hypothetical protein
MPCSCRRWPWQLGQAKHGEHDEERVWAEGARFGSCDGELVETQLTVMQRNALSQGSVLGLISFVLVINDIDHV